MSDEREESRMPELPSVEKGPREPADQDLTGTGTPRSADDGLQEPGAVGDRHPGGVDPAVVVGGTTSSHPAAADEVDVNRSGSGGTGGASAPEETDT